MPIPRTLNMALGRLRDLSLIENLLKIFSVRAAVELERLYADQARSEKERALIKSEDRLRATVAAALDCIIAMDRDGQVIEFNPAAEACYRQAVEVVTPATYT